MKPTLVCPECGSDYIAIDYVKETWVCLSCYCEWYFDNDKGKNVILQHGNNLSLTGEYKNKHKGE